MNWFDLGKNHVWLPYTQMGMNPQQLEVESASGVTIKLKDGREIIDGISSWWSLAHGYNHPKIVEAIQKQAEKLSHIMFAGFAHEHSYKLAYNLAQITPKSLNKVFFSDSGSVAIEVAMKMSIQFFLNSQDNNKNKFISFQNGYHGDTAGAMSLSDLECGMHKKFSKYLQKNFCLKLPENDNDLNYFDDFLQKNHRKIAGLIIEPLVQCAGGMKFYNADILQKIYHITKKYDIIFIADECATGFYRTGEIFAVNEANIVPDIICLSKALTGGHITLAATVCTDDIYNKFLHKSDLNMALMHGPTFMANPISCAAANASMELFQLSDYRLKVKNIEATLKKELSKLTDLPNVVDIRVKGAIGVVETNFNWQEIFTLREEFVKYGVWLKPFSGLIYVMPSLTISKAELSVITDAILRSLK
ncbi:MAG: adenosylmethionine-8-amino-7-oxononanoate aminotransferase [Ulvibacter sp.]|jgi:adenosylmethionine-8-amino-7-oxononanoate aminotransferase